MQVHTIHINVILTQVEINSCIEFGKFLLLV